MAAIAKFRLGRLDCTVVSDGILELDPPGETFPDADPADLVGVFDTLGLPHDRVRMEQNILVIDDGERKVMFDSGVGCAHDWGRRRFGEQTGKVADALRTAGIDPAEIAIVALTHPHPDHGWGLVDDAGEPVYPGASVALGRADYAYFTDPNLLAAARAAGNSGAVDRHAGATRNLAPYADRVILLDDGALVTPDVTAISTPGHTPGHVAYRIVSNGASLLLWGDLCHHPALLERSWWSLKFDTDPAAAVSSRLRIMNGAADSGENVLSYHFAYPGTGRLERAGESFRWVPVDLS
jgi:glyoxylase-like metal-dependent hydrolase (beta-lactamase superfamily II)